MNHSRVLALLLVAACAVFVILRIEAHSYVDLAAECADKEQTAFDTGRRWERLHIALTTRLVGYAELEGLLHTVSVWTARAMQQNPEVMENLEQIMAHQAAMADRLAELMAEDRSLYASMNDYRSVADLGTSKREYVPVPFITLEMRGHMAAESLTALRDELTTIRDGLIDIMAKEDDE